MAQYTQGPWHYGFSTVEPLIEVYAYTDNKRSSVRLAEIPLTKGGKDNDQMEANARLIVKSPDLLEIVEGMVMFPDVRKHIAAKFPGLVEKAQALIAEIEGGAK